MSAKVIKEFPGVCDGETQVRDIKVGEIIHGDLAAVAVREKWAEEISEKEAAKQAKADAGEELDGMTVAELKDFAETNGIDLGDAKKKDDILDAIKAAKKAA